jgi:cytochrome c-type biogenesis protein CcmH
MALWVIFAFLTAIATIAVLRPFWRIQGGPPSTTNDIAVYKQQLREIEDEAARGLLGQAEAEAARIEMSRRILAAAADAESRPPSIARQAIYAPYILAALLPAIALSLYVAYGSPQLPAFPLASRTPDNQSIPVLVARVEERLERHPDDGKGWSVIAPVYMRLGRYADAAEAFRNASRLLGESAERAANLGEALALANGGTIDADAKQAFERALVLDANHPKSRFWLAVAQEQAGRPGDALASYRKLLEGQIPEAVAQVVRERVALLEGAPVSAGTPGAGGVDAAQVNQMVSGLAEQLKKDGTDLKGWLMLVRAYMVLGRKDDAMSALNEARGQFAGNDDALGEINALAKSLGLPS